MSYSIHVLLRPEDKEHTAIRDFKREASATRTCIRLLHALYPEKWTMNTAGQYIALNSLPGNRVIAFIHREGK